MLGGRLLPQLDGRVVGAHDRGRRRERRVVDVAADEGPPVFGVAEQRIYAGGADANVEAANGAAARNVARIVGREQVGDDVEIVGAARHRRAELSSGQREFANAVIDGEQRRVERLDGSGPSEVDAERTRAAALDDVL